METTNLDHNELFEAYRKGELSAEALQQFEQLLNSSENIQQEFKEYLTLAKSAALLEKPKTILGKSAELIEKSKTTPKADIDQLVEIANAVEQRNVPRPEPKVIPLWRKVVNVSTAAALVGAAFLGVMIGLETTKPENPRPYIALENINDLYATIGANQEKDIEAFKLYKRKDIKGLRQHANDSKTYESQYLLAVLLLPEKQARVSKASLEESIRLFEKMIVERKDLSTKSIGLDAKWNLANCYLSLSSRKEEGKRLLRELANSNEQIAQKAKSRLVQIENMEK